MDDNEYETYDAEEHIDAEFEEELKKRVAEDEAAIYGDEEEEEDLEEEEAEVNNATSFAQLTSAQIKDNQGASFSPEHEQQPEKELGEQTELDQDDLHVQEAGPSTSTSSFYHQQNNNNNLPQITSTQLLPQKPSIQSFPYDDPVVHNIVATANFSVPLDLNQIVVKIRNSEYNPKRFRAVIMRIYEPRTTMMLFSSGKVVITGAKSDRDACTAARKCCRILQLIGYEVGSAVFNWSSTSDNKIYSYYHQTKFREFKIQNIVSTVDIKFPIRLDKLSHVHTQFCTYDPDFFPALIYRMVRPRTVLLVFVSGKIILTGTVFFLCDQVLIIVL